MMMMMIAVCPLPSLSIHSILDASQKKNNSGKRGSGIFSVSTVCKLTQPLTSFFFFFWGGGGCFSSFSKKRCLRLDHLFYILLKVCFFYLLLSFVACALLYAYMSLSASVQTKSARLLLPSVSLVFLPKSTKNARPM